MPPIQLVVPGVCRYTMNGINQGRAIANIIDMRIDTTGSTSSRADAVFEQAGILINEWCDHILPRITNEYSFTDVSWVDLDDTTGSTGSRSVTAQETLPQFGTLATPSLVSNVALLVRKQISGARGLRNGRMYINALDEDATAADTPNVLPGAQVTAWNAQLASFLGNINQEDFDPLAYQSEMVVVHITSYLPNDNGGLSPATGVANPVIALSVDSRLATQRRRLRG